MTAPDGEDREALRRRLYRPGASPADVAAYAGREDPRPAPLSPERAPVPPVRSRRLPAVAVLTAAVLIAAVALTRAGHPARERPAPDPTPTPAAVVETVVRTATADRNGFVRALTAADRAGIGPWLDRHAERLPGVLAQATRSDTLEFTGSGSRTLLLDPPSVGDDGGHVTVLAVTAVDARLTWTLLGDAPDLARGAVAGTRTAVQRAGALTSSSVDWLPGRRPGTLLVVAPDGVRWGVAAVFSS